MSYSHLTLVAVCEDEPIAFEPPPFSLRFQPQRPGELSELIDVPLETAAADRIRAQAGSVGLPIELAIYIAIESERALEEAAVSVGLSRETVAEFLDAVAARALDRRGPRHVLVRPLEDYAAAIARGLTASAAPGHLYARVPQLVAARWAHEAAASGVPLEHWVEQAAGRTSVVRVPWEAAAAREGRTLGEWVLLQAARCARSRSTSPQTTASG
jgi:hypothetical protein